MSEGSPNGKKPVPVFEVSDVTYRYREVKALDHLNLTVGAGRRNAETGRWEDVHVAGRSDMALVRSLRSGRRREIAVRMLILHENEGLRRDEATYPDLPASRTDARLPAVSNRAANRLAGRASPPLRGRPSVVHAQPGAPAAA